MASNKLAKVPKMRTVQPAKDLSHNQESMASRIAQRRLERAAEREKKFNLKPALQEH
jgi:hypothetical protein